MMIRLRVDPNVFLLYAYCRYCFLYHWCMVVCASCNGNLGICIYSLLDVPHVLTPASLTHPSGSDAFFNFFVWKDRTQTVRHTLIAEIIRLCDSDNDKRLPCHYVALRNVFLSICCFAPSA
jgi:hypothetical protein